MKNVLNTLLDILFVFWIFFYFLLLYFYIELLIDKINRPSFKNLSWQDFWILGFIFFGLLILNVIVITRKIKKFKKTY